MELTKRDTKMLQGISVIAMLWLHLFNKDYEGLFQPILFLKGIPLSYYISQLSDFCVFGFAFCSGYAHMKLFHEEAYYKKRLKSLIYLVINYWIVIAVFSVISILAGQAEFMPGSIEKLLGNLFLYDVSYNGAWWYMWAYVLLVVISPIILKFIEKVHPIFSLGAGFFVYCLAYYFRFVNYTGNYFLDIFGPFGMTLFEYMIGCVVCKICLFSKIKKLTDRIPQAIMRGGHMS